MLTIYQILKRFKIQWVSVITNSVLEVELSFFLCIQDKKRLIFLSKAN